MSELALSIGRHSNGFSCSKTEYWLLADGNAVAFAVIFTRDGDPHDVLCDIESRFHRLGYATALIEKIAEFTGRELKITGCCTPQGFAFLTAAGLEQTPEGLEDHGTMGAPGYTGGIDPMKFVEDWDNQFPRYPV